MNVEPVLIDDDDVDMEPVVILDEDDEKIISGNEVAATSVPTVETIVLDDESPKKTGDTNNAAKKNKKRSLKKSEKTFVNNLKNNSLMDKIVSKCINMENSTGMPRVIHKTVLPLYRDANNTFKESGSFRALLKKTYKLLIRDPDHKFLHIKTLCEELKSGGLRRKVPFVTLATDLKKNSSQWDHEEFTSSSREINQNNAENRQIHNIYTNNKTRKRLGSTETKRKEKKTKKYSVNAKDRIKTRSAAHAEKEKTDIIDLDDSDTDSGDRSENDIIIIEETEPSDQRNDNVNTVLQETLEAESKKGNQVVQETLESEFKKGNQVVQETLEAESKKGNQVVQETLEAESKKGNQVVQETLEAESKKGNQVVQETLEAESKKGNQVVQETLEAESKKGNQVVQETLEAGSKKGNQLLQKTLEAESKNITLLLGQSGKKGNQVVQETLEADANKENKVVQETVEEDSNIENSDENSRSSDNEMDYELLIPKTHVILEVLPIEYDASDKSTNDLETITRLENQIANYKRMIDKLEEEEVMTESRFASPYFLCSKYKENVLACYKQICEIKGNCKDIVKRREIRLIVAEGHPPGPAKRLEQFLNSTIDKTGTVAFPDFSDVVKCVVEANLFDKLAWNRQQEIQEAVALFRQCGQALRTRRQKREYRDLLSLIRDKEQTDDPAEKDPILLAKLEQNKLIAKLKEEEILDRYVRMENNATPRVEHPQVGNAVEFELDQDSSGSDSESEQNITLPSNTATSTINNQNVTTINNQNVTGECSRSNINLSLLRTNNTILTSSLRNNQYCIGPSLKANDVIVNQDPMLMYFLTTPNATQSHEAGTAINEDQYATGESSIMKDAISNNDSVMLPTNTKMFTHTITMHNECSDKGEMVNKLELTITETVVGFNNATLNGNSDMSSINSNINVENTEAPVNTEPCTVNCVQDNVSSATDNIEQNCDSSICKEGVEVTTADNVKREPLDIQNMLDELGDGFVCQVFDIEDPFLVIEISSDGFSDDEL